MPAGDFTCAIGSPMVTWIRVAPLRAGSMMRLSKALILRCPAKPGLEGRGRYVAILRDAPTDLESTRDRHCWMRKSATAGLRGRFSGRGLSVGWSDGPSIKRLVL